MTNQITINQNDAAMTPKRWNHPSPSLDADWCSQSEIWEAVPKYPINTFAIQ